MAAKSSKSYNFKKSYEQLQELVAWFEREDVDLEEGIKKYEEGMELVKGLKEYLNGVENKITELKKKK